MTFYHRLRALMAGQRVFWISDLRRVTFAKDLDRCRGRFRTYTVEEHRWWCWAVFILFNRYL